MSRGLSARRLRPSSAPSAAASAAPPDRLRRSRKLPSARATSPVRCSRPSGSSRAWAPIGVRQDPSSSASSARSAVDDGARLRILDRRQQVAQFGVVVAHGDADDALAGRRHHRRGVQHHARFGREAEPAAARPAPAARRRTSPARTFREPRLHVAAQQPDAQVRPRVQQLRLSPHRTVPTSAPVGSAANGSAGSGVPQSRPEDQRVARILARQRAGQHDAGRQRRSPGPSGCAPRNRPARPPAPRGSPWQTAPCRRSPPAAGPAPRRRWCG